MLDYIFKKLCSKLEEYFEKHEGEQNFDQQKAKEEIEMLIVSLQTLIEYKKLPITYRYLKEDE